MILGTGGGRWVGLVPMALAFGVWAGGERPSALIADNGTFVGIMTLGGRALSKAKGAGFVARNWLENDGDGQPRKRLAARLWQ